jgi:hypothetical protein
MLIENGEEPMMWTFFICEQQIDNPYSKCDSSGSGKETPKSGLVSS